MQDIQFLFNKACSLEAARSFAPAAKKAQQDLEEGTGLGNDFLGWLRLPEDIKSQLADIQACAEMLRRECEMIVCIGIGGSYLGAKAVIDALSNSFAWLKNQKPAIVYAGQNIGEDYLFELQELLKDKRFGIISISKSGTTTEPALAFRLLKTQLEQQEGKDFARKHIICITDAKRGALRTLATQENLKTYVIEDNIGGRFSVLSPVGLLPIACAGFDIQALIDGACRMMEVCRRDAAFEAHPAALYAAARNVLYQKEGKKVELLVNFNPKLHFIAEWWKQLYGESEGKDHKGIFPASVDFTTDLHSMGQYIQDGERHLMETVISVAQPEHEVIFPHDDANLDGLNFLAGKRVDEVNKMAELGTQIAHVDGGVPNMQIIMPKLNEFYLGELIYFFELACGISGYLLEVNPFNQPGVEAYKKNMFALLDKPGYEAESAAIRQRINA
ncbi:MAG: glucose-6-phosphate isomerase [Paludibacteraceae bacterium]|nr:glucose-6-phosphate isomerase [Paludibacteraceae bacterium]